MGGHQETAFDGDTAGRSVKAALPCSTNTSAHGNARTPERRPGSTYRALPPLCNRHGPVVMQLGIVTSEARQSAYTDQRVPGSGRGALVKARFVGDGCSLLPYSFVTVALK